MKVKINKDKIVQLSIQGTVSQPSGGNYVISAEGESRIVPGIGGITYNLCLGDRAFGWEGDHIEPEVSLENKDKQASEALNILACIGNETVVTSGEAKGERGYVIGRHSGAEHVMIHMLNRDALDKLAIGDSFRIKAWGTGTKIEGFEEVSVTCLDPNLLEKIISINDNGKLEVPVTVKIPAKLMGSGMGMKSYRGDYDIATYDRKQIDELGIINLRMGDFVLLEDCLNCYGRSVRRGAVSIGIVIHSDCILPGHGPGIVDILSAPTTLIEGRLGDSCNLLDYM
jgi:hypothetical protein